METEKIIFDVGLNAGGFLRTVNDFSNIYGYNAEPYKQVHYFVPNKLIKLQNYCEDNKLNTIDWVNLDICGLNEKYFQEVKDLFEKHVIKSGMFFYSNDQLDLILDIGRTLEGLGYRAINCCLGGWCYFNLR